MITRSDGYCVQYYYIINHNTLEFLLCSPGPHQDLLDTSPPWSEGISVSVQNPAVSKEGGHNKIDTEFDFLHTDMHDFLNYAPVYCSEKQTFSRTKRLKVCLSML